MKTAILVDGDFYLRRHAAHFGRENSNDAKKVADDFWVHCIRHIDKQQQDRLFRIYFYDCPPLDKKLHYPISERPIDLGKTPTARFRKNFHQEILRKRNVALRLGYLDSENGAWRIADAKKNKLLLQAKVWI
jgi:hypothetical protein